MTLEREFAFVDEFAAARTEGVFGVRVWQTNEGGTVMSEACRQAGRRKEGFVVCVGAASEKEY